MARLSTRQRQTFDASGAIPPVGTIIAYAPGYYAAGGNGGGWSHVGPSANTVTAVNSHLPANWRVCDGTAPNDADSPIFNSTGRFLPDLTGSRFVMGNTSAGATGGNANNMKTLSTPELPGHTHPAGTLSADAVNAPHGHPATVLVPSTGSATPHIHGGGRATGNIGGSAFGLTVAAAYEYRVMVSQSASSPYNGSWPGPQSVAEAVSTPHSHPGASVSIATANAPHGHPALSGATGPQGSGDSFSILPQYVSVFYIMRIK